MRSCRRLRLFHGGCFLAGCLALPSPGVAQQNAPLLSRLAATKDSPIYTTYCASRGRSQFIVDKGYHFVFYDSSQGLSFTCEQGGDIGVVFGLDGRRAAKLGEYLRGPVITTSYSDVVKFHVFPFEGIRVDAAFVVHSSRAAFLDLTIHNESSASVRLDVSPTLVLDKSPLSHLEPLPAVNGVSFTHHESPDKWTVAHEIPFAQELNDLVASSSAPQSIRAGNSWTGEIDRLPAVGSEEVTTDSLHLVALCYDFAVAPGDSVHLRMVRAVTRPGEDAQAALDDARELLGASVDPYVQANEALYRGIPVLSSGDPDKELMYWSAFTLLCQVMLPAEEKCSFNYYVFSREPQWGWGHGGQVFHESLAMLAYAIMDPVGAMNSQRVFAERQHRDGYMNYRTGPYLDETIPYNDQLTTSAPWYAWENLEVYRLAHNREFLAEAYSSGVRLFTYFARNRDSDGDGLCEWGGHAVLESVRDGDVAVWDQVGWPSNFEALDLNALLVKEAQSLAAMARELGLEADAETWDENARARAERINHFMWDDQTGFYYHVNKETHGFTFRRPNDLKREEIIGFLPLWAGIADSHQARRLVEKLTDPKKFWRPYGVPSLAADDPYYNPKGYWNGPMWVEWNYLIVRGLIDYGYYEEARGLVNRVATAMIAQLKKDHNFWEFYSPDELWAGYHKTYIWAGLISRMLLDVRDLPR
jgi:hypothetical protein